MGLLLPAAPGSAWGRRSQSSTRPPAQELVPKYPIVLAPGVMGFRVMGYGRVHIGEYFRGVAKHLRQRGYEVLTPYVGLTNSVPARARRLREQILERFPSGKVNIIAHSLGGLDSRYMINHLEMSDRVASLTTVATPHRGSYVADWVYEFIGQDLGVLRLCKVLGLNVDALKCLTTAWCKKFNELTPPLPQVRYFSFGGKQPWYQMPLPLIPFSWMIKYKERAMAGEALHPVAERSLRTKSWGSAVADYIKKSEAEVVTRGPDERARAWYKKFKGENDGMVRLSTTVYGEEFRIVPMDHWDQIGWLTLQSTARFYEAIVVMLATKGL